MSQDETSFVKKFFLIVVAAILFVVIFNTIKNDLALSEGGTSGKDYEESKNYSKTTDETTRRPTTTKAPVTKAPETEAPKISKGSRNNPVPVGETANFDGYTWYKYCTEVTVTQVMRGKKALNFVLAADNWNDSPEKGYEYLLVRVRVKAVDTKGQGAASVNRYDFDFVTEDGVTIDDSTYLYGIKPALTDVYQGGTTEGYIWCEVPVGEKILISYQDGNLWFSLE